MCTGFFYLCCSPPLAPFQAEKFTRDLKNKRKKSSTLVLLDNKELEDQAGNVSS